MRNGMESENEGKGRKGMRKIKKKEKETKRVN